MKRVEKIRLIANYKGDAIELEQAVWAVEQAAVFVKAIREGFTPDAGTPAYPTSDHQ